MGSAGANLGPWLAKIDICRNRHCGRFGWLGSRSCADTPENNCQLFMTTWTRTRRSKSYFRHELYPRARHLLHFAESLARYKAVAYLVYSCHISSHNSFLFQRRNDNAPSLAPALPRQSLLIRSPNTSLTCDTTEHCNRHGFTRQALNPPFHKV
jgi:hypothetical protein